MVRHEYDIGFILNTQLPNPGSCHSHQIHVANPRCKFLKHTVPSIDHLISSAYEVVEKHNGIVRTKALRRNLTPADKEWVEPTVCHLGSESEIVEHAVATLASARRERYECETTDTPRLILMPSWQTIEQSTKYLPNLLGRNKLHGIK